MEAIAVKKRKRDSKQIWAVLFVTPNVILFILFFIAPAVIGLKYSFTNYNGLMKNDWVGLGNYRKLLSDPEFYSVLWNTVKYSLITVPLGYVTALGLALILASSKIQGNGLLRVLIYWPTLLSTIIVGLTWKWLFGENFGLINYLLKLAGMAPIGWATNPTAAFITTVVASVWHGCGTNMLIFIGGLKQVSEDLYEAAMIDGANSWERFRYITMPALVPVSFMVIMLSTINSFKVFAMVQTLTNGGPGTATTYMIQYIYNTGFEKMKVGYSSAASMILFVILLVLSVVQTKINNKMSDY